jgi:site-specific DNA-adenine methylase
MPSHPSPLRYPGAKHALAPLLADVLVHNDLHDGVVVEPFAGGAGASLRLMLDEFASELVLNDADPRIRNLYAALSPRSFELSYSAYRRSTGRELIVFDPRLKVPTEMLQARNRPGRLHFSTL